MKSDPPTTDGKASKADSDQAAMAILLTLADTTWRIFTPVIIMTGLGIWADLHFKTKPWITLTAVAIGFALAILLVRAQLKAAAAMENKK